MSKTKSFPTLLDYTHPDARAYNQIELGQTQIPQ